MCNSANNSSISRNPRRVALLGAANSIHTIRWANGLAERGIEVHVLTLHAPGRDLSPQVHVHRLGCRAPLGYVLAASRARRLLAQIQPELLNAHYASGYGLLARLAGFGPTLLSAWGSDIYQFPHKSKLHRRIVADNLRFATLVGSTSHAMARRIEAIQPVPIAITPFGIDHALFFPCARPASAKDAPIVIGAIKALEHQYGIDTLLRAFQIVVSQLDRSHPEVARRLELRIYGKGSQRKKLKKLACDLQLDERVVFAGFIPHAKVPEALANLDIYVALSRQDSFGVAILEASSCGVPVVVSDADGPAEVVADNESGFIVPVDDPGFAAARIVDLVLNPERRAQMAARGREHVLQHYTWDHSLDLMLEAYRKTLCLAHSGTRSPSP
ncbi:glycosyltransferase [Bordetella petrii]|uniref:Lipopolysaccharides biosynthesis glycosyltransferase n=1 Tax=Bordetella petrii (strain ATCC BAA-461 / DSM 12804 / CCUG 43448 / CIP 107267 / Se-1111R) TaxID=340100 RepID=A9IHA3_BORPD|nr:glycosyltransferase [Bordetella petrii]CAP45174.1 lipopolysaccharides biosynthesis glycosyltransferase [Bordetella petrii]